MTTEQKISFTPDFTSSAKIIATDLANEHSAKEGPLFAREAYIKQKTDSLCEQFLENFYQSKKNAELAGTLLREKLELLPEKDAISQEFARAVDMITLLDKPEEFMKYKGDISVKSYQAFVGLSDETLLWMYQVGDQFFEEQHFEEAFAIFSLVTQLNPLVCDFWIAFALTQMKLNTPLEAINSFASAIVADPFHPIPRYQSAKLYLQLEQKQDAMIELEVLEEIIRFKQLDSLSPLVTELKELIGAAK